MVVFKSDDIAGKRDSQGRITCRECMSIEEFNELEQDEIIKQSDLANTDDTYFCDELREEIVLRGVNPHGRLHKIVLCKNEMSRVKI